MNKLFTKTDKQALDFDLLYRSSRDDLFAYIYGVLQDKARAEDVVQTAFEKAFRYRTKYKSKKGQPRAWLFGIARNVMLDELKKSTDLPLLAEEQAVAEDGDIAQRLDLQRLLKSLSAGDRELLALKYWAGMNNRQIAEITKLSESNVGTRLQRILTTLREDYNG